MWLDRCPPSLLRGAPLKDRSPWIEVASRLGGGQQCPGPCSASNHLPGEDSAAAAGESVGVLLPEHVAHAAAGDDLQAAPTLPHAEGDL